MAKAMQMAKRYCYELIKELFIVKGHAYCKSKNARKYGDIKKFFTLFKYFPLFLLNLVSLVSGKFLNKKVPNDEALKFSFIILK